MARRGGPAAAAAFVAGSVVVLDPGGLAPFGPLKWAATTVLLLSTAALVSRRVAAVACERVWVAFLVVAALAAVAGVDPLYGWLGTPERHFGVLTWVLCAVAFRTGAGAAIPAVQRGAAIACAVIGCWVTAEMFGWEPTALVGAGGRPVGTLGSSAFLGAAAVLLTPAAAALPRRWSWTAVGGLVALALSGARAAWVAAVVLVVAGAWLRRSWRPMLGLASVVVVVVSVVGGVSGRAWSVVTDDEGGIAGRVDEWRIAARVILDDPLSGAGPEGYRIAFARAVDDEYEIAHGRTPLPDRAHSSLLDVAATTGLPGLAAYLVLVVLVGRRLLAAARHGSSAEAAVAVGVLGYWVQSLFLFPVAELDLVAWFGAGAVIATTAPIRATTEVGRVARGAFAVAAIAAALVGVADVAADRAARSSLERLDDADAARRLRPDQLRYHLAAARVREGRGELDAALAAVSDALQLSPADPVARGEQARLLLEAGRRDGDVSDALVVLEDLAADDPRNAAVLLRLGVARALARDVEGAESAFLEAERLAPSSAAASTNLAVLYLESGRTSDAAAAARRALGRDPGAERAQRVLEKISGT